MTRSGWIGQSKAVKSSIKIILLKCNSFVPFIICLKSVVIEILVVEYAI